MAARSYEYQRDAAFKYEAAFRPSQNQVKKSGQKSRRIPASENPIAACLAPMALRAH
jgi:hypothetical protein